MLSIFGFSEITSSFNPASAKGTNKTKNKIIVTVHDFTWKTFPSFKNPLKKFFYNRVFSGAIKKADKIIAVSEHTKKDIIRFYKIIPEKIKVIYEGVN